MPFRCTLALEAIGGIGLPRWLWKRRPWVAEIVGVHSRWGFERRFLRAKIDYRNANSVGTRGIMQHYLLDEGKVYEVSAMLAWQNSERYLARVVDGSLVRISKQEAVACLIEK